MTSKIINLPRYFWLSILIGIVLGGSVQISHANTIFKYIASGSQYDTFAHTHASPSHSFSDSHSVWANSSYPSTTSFSVYSASYGGGSGAGANFGLVHLYDLAGNNLQTYYDFQCDLLTSNPTKSLNWSYSGLSQSNNGVIYETWVNDGLCIQPNSSYLHYSDWVAQ